MEPVTLALLISAGVAAVKGIVGAAQASKGGRLAKGNKRPEYNIPGEYKDYLNNAKAAAANDQLPGQQAMEQKIGGSTASGIRSLQEGASSSAGLMAGIAGLKGGEQAALTDVGIAGAQFQQANKDKLQSALLKYGNIQDQAFDINQMQPYQDKAAAAQALKGAGAQNIMTGLEGIGGAAQVGASEGMFGKKSPAAPAPAAPAPAAPAPAASTPFGMSSSTSRLGMGAQNSALTQQTNQQKFLAAQRKGFTGDMNSWLMQQSLSAGLNFNLTGQ